MRKLVAYGLTLALAGAAAPAAAVTWNGVQLCSNPLDVCMTFTLTEPTAGNFTLIAAYGPGPSGSTLNSFGLEGGLTATNINVVGYTGYVSGPKAWTVGASGMGNPALFVVAAADNGAGLDVPGYVEVSFQSTASLTALSGTIARAHIQRLGPTATCSMQWSSDAPGYVQSLGGPPGTDCGGTTVPEPVSLVLLGSGLLGLGGLRMRRRNRK